MARTRVKICGITRVDDALAAARLGVDAIGLVFYPKSRRVVDVTGANEIIASLPPFVTTVGLFLDAEHADVTDILNRVALDLLQFHGDETAAYCESFERPFIKAVPMRVAADVQAYAETFTAAKALLLDSHGDGVIGGSGECFDWRLIPTEVAKPIVLAGGLNARNIAEAVRRIRPYAVDVSSGVESAKGVKSNELMREFMDKLEPRGSIPSEDYATRI